MPAARIGMALVRAACALVFLGCSAMAAAQPAESHWQLDIGWGHESQTSPVFQISPEGNILYLDGQQGLSGSHIRTSLQGSASWNWEQGVTTALAADATLKRAPNAPGLDFASLSIQPSIHRPFGAANVGMGLNVLSYDVGGRHFRDAMGVQADWTKSDGHQLWGVVAEWTQERHAADFSDMDATATSVVVLRQYTDPLPGIEGLDFSAIVGREVNAHGYLDLSSHSAMLTGTVRWSWLGAEWSVGRSWREARFEDSAFPSEPARADHTVMTDIAAQWPVAANRSVRVEYNEVRNTSNTRLYDNTFQQLSVTLRSSW